MARNPAANAAMKEARLEKIHQSALLLFASKGLAATRIGDIARESGMSMGLVYHYYASKEAVYTALVQTAFKRLNTAVDALESMPQSAWEKIEMALTSIGNDFINNTHSRCYHLLIAQSDLYTEVPEQARRIIDSERRKPYKAMSRIIKKGQEEGSIIQGDAEALATMFWLLVKGMAMHSAAQKDQWPDVEIMMRIFKAN